MKTLLLADHEGNRGTWALTIPDKMQTWKVESFREFLVAGTEDAINKGFLPQSTSLSRHEVLRQMVLFPETTFNCPILFKQQGQLLESQDTIELENPVTRVELDRLDANLNPEDISVCQRNLRAWSSCRNHLRAIIDCLLNFDAAKIKTKGGRSIESIEELEGCFSEKLDARNQLRLLYTAAKVIYSSPFENTTKILAGRPVLTGYEMWENFSQGLGGVCAEKTAAMQFLCDVLGISSSPILGSDSIIPYDFDQSLKTFLISNGKVPLPVDIYHHMLEVHLDCGSYLLDITNGNLPMQFLDTSDTERLINGGYRARMVYRVDRLNLKRMSRWVGDALLTLGEYHVPEMMLQYVFKQGLGLHISSKEYIGVFFDWGGERTANQQKYYSSLAKKVGFPYPYFIHENNTHSIPGESLQLLLRQVRESLRLQYADSKYTGDFTFVIQPLMPNLWTIPRISDSVRKVLRL